MVKPRQVASRCKRRKFAFKTRTEYMPNMAHAPSFELDYGLASFLDLSGSVSLAFLTSPTHSISVSNPSLRGSYRRYSHCYQISIDLIYLTNARGTAAISISTAGGPLGSSLATGGTCLHGKPSDLYN